MRSIKKILEEVGLFDKKDTIRAFWWAGEGNRNFGDIITPYLIEKITGKTPVLSNKYCFREYYIMTGSVIEFSSRNAIIWGTGMMYRHQRIRKPKKICAVRGPITRRRLLELGYECPDVYGDPALLLPRFYNKKVKKQYQVGLIPHYIDYKKVKKSVLSENVLVIDLLNPVEAVIDQIKSCRKTVSSSLHGIIVSQAYGIPSIWAELSDKLSGDGTKFRDYFLSVNITPYKGVDLSNVQLSDDLLNQCVEDASDEITIDLDKLLDACPLSDIL